MGDRARERDRFRMMITGGGTGGHVYPGLAVAEAVKILDPAAEIRFVGTARGLESVLVPRAGYRLHMLPASGFRGQGAAGRLRFLINLFFGTVTAFYFILRYRPHIILGTGGFVSLPLMIAGRLLRRTLLLQEQNSIPGSTNRLVGRWCRRIYLGFADAARHFPRGRTVHTGNPLRRGFSREVATAGGRREPMSDGILRILVSGGSRGAHTLNRAMIEAADLWAGHETIELLIQTGPRDKADVELAWRDKVFRAVRVEPFIENMPDVLDWADLVICRAGAMTLAELACAGRPAVLVPFPYATDDHQTANARDLEVAGAAVVVPDDACTGMRLVEIVAQLVADGHRLGLMAEASRRLARENASAEIATDILRRAGLLPEQTERS